MRLKNRRIGFCLILYILFSPLIADSQTTEDIFNQGVAAFKKGLYPTALDYFLQAERAGMVNARLYYNLGAIYYQQKNYAAAYSAFEKATTGKDLASVAYFNMALSAYKQSDLDLTKKNFQEAYNHANTGKQRTQALYMASKAGILLTRNTWSGFVKTLIGTNDNVILIDDGAATNEVDEFLSLYALIDKNIFENVNVSLSSYALEYQDQDEHNFVNLIFNTSYRMDLENWSVDVAAEIEKSYLASDPFQNNSGLRAKVLYKITSGFSLGSRIWLRNIRSKDKNYDHLEGKMQQLELSSNFNSRSYMFKLFMSYEWNDRLDFNQNEVLDNSYSPERASLGLINTTQFANKSLLSISLIFRESEYPTVENSDLKTRETQRYQFNLSYQYPLDERWRLLGEYHYLDSDSNDDLFIYSSNIISMGIMWR